MFFKRKELPRKKLLSFKTLWTGEANIFLPELPTLQMCPFFLIATMSQPYQKHILHVYFKIMKQQVRCV